MYPQIGKVLGGFHHRVMQIMTVWMPQRNRDGTFTYPTLEEAMEEEGIQEMETYIDCSQNTAAQYIATRPFMDLCMAGGRPWKWGLKRWEKQEIIYLEGIWEAAQVEEAEKDRGGERAGEDM